MPVPFFLFLYIISLHGAPTVETILMGLYKSEQLSEWLTTQASFAILTFSPKSAFTEQTTNFRFVQEQDSVVDEAFIK